MSINGDTFWNILYIVCIIRNMFPITYDFIFGCFNELIVLFKSYFFKARGRVKDIISKISKLSVQLKVPIRITEPFVHVNS